MRNILPILLPLWAFLVKEIVSAPLGHIITDPRLNDPKDEEAKAQAKTVDKAVSAANEHIDEMHNVITNHHVSHNWKLVQDAFGRNPNVPEIAKNVEHLRNGQIQIAHLNKPSRKPTSMASTDMKTNHISLKPGFYDKRRDSHAAEHEYRGGILIHEATHALFGAHDQFSKDSGRPLGSNEADKLGADRKWKGYAHSADFETLKKENSRHMHTNADSYNKFGRVVMEASRAAHTASHGNIHPQEHVKKNTEPVHTSHTTAQDHDHGLHTGDHAGPSHTSHAVTVQGHHDGQTPPSPVTAKSRWHKVKTVLKIGKKTPKK
jgi:hypothetical protein